MKSFLWRLEVVGIELQVWVIAFRPNTNVTPQKGIAVVPIAAKFIWIRHTSFSDRNQIVVGNTRIDFPALAI